ncbi:MAG TPA: PEP/pyruvate-binding domain-containing protein [Syntrophorhabdaceae bacterium]|nr:PEP/pyruvate-binding domain-containing protein [Syntrophorhabdaceae bacterium]
MTTFESISTGIKGLDAVLNKLRIGDNVVWQVENIDDYSHYVIPFVQKRIEEGKRVVYLRFAEHKPILNQSDKIKIYQLDANSGFEAFTTQAYNIVSQEGKDVFYIFDCLSSLLSAWANDLMIGNFFVIMCPYLFEMNTIAYFSILRGHHSFKTIARIRETTQLLIEVYNHEGNYYIHPLKVWNRYSPTMFLPHLEEDNDFIPVINSIDATQLFSDISEREAKSAKRHLDYWDRLFLKAEDMLKGTRNQDEHREMIDELCRIMIARDGKMFELARRTFTLEDLLNIKSRLIGTGFIGGKTVGMLLARKILEKDRWLNWNQYLEHHDSYYIGSDIFYTYIVQNGLWKLRMEQKTKQGYFKAAERLKDGILKGVFPEEIKEQFQQIIEYFGQSPIIIRSSSLLEDAFGNAFAGKYESIFSVNQGPPDYRYKNFEESIRHVYASTMNEDALTYRLQRGLDELDEQMALLVQRVSGTYRKYYFFPDIAGVGISYNTFVWKQGLDPKSGMLRLVLGLGTRAVNRVENDYPRIVAIDNPSSNPNADMDDRRKYSQHYVDLLNINENKFETTSFLEIIEKGLNIRLDLLATYDHESTEKLRALGKKDKKIWILTFDNLLTKTSFIGVMHRMMKKLEEIYNYPVEIEFTVNFTRYNDYKINLLQCRPLQTKGIERRFFMPERIPDDMILFKSEGHFMGGNISKSIKKIIYVNPFKYSVLSLLDKYTIARLIGRLNKNIKNRDEESVLLLGPGRWGTTTPSLGVPVRFSEINNFSALGEIAYLDGNLLPELSYGTHFFQDLVETDIFYLALFPDNPSCILNINLLESFDNILKDILEEGYKYEDVLKVYDTSQIDLKLVADIISQKVICFGTFERLPEKKGTEGLIKTLKS